MATQSEGAAAEVEDESSPNSRGYLSNRLRQLRRIALLFASALAVASAIFALWWVTSLNGLPEISDPFDVAAFRAFHVPEEQNAFSYLRRALAKLTPVAELPGRPTPDDPRFSWSRADPALQQWADANREALTLFFQAAEQRDASLEAGDAARDLDPARLIWLAFLDARRRQENGDLAGSWECHRAVLRVLAHCGRRGSTALRFSAKGASRTLNRRLTEWAADSRTTIPQLHTALNVVLENAPTSEWDVSAIKSGYLELMRAVEHPMPRSRQEAIEGAWGTRLGGVALSDEMLDHLDASRRFVLREPERSRRVLRLLCASYLAHAESRETPPKKPAAWARVSYVASTNPVTNGTMVVPLYPVSPSAPAAAHSLPPEKLAGWFVSTLDARLQLLRDHGADWPWPPDRALNNWTVSFRRAHHGLAIMLATELYRRERGSPPDSDDALVGPYLDHLPDGGSPDFNDGTAPIID
jgi:hypothetical protein